MVSQLRQDNTELRHRLRHGGNALNNSIVSSNNAAISSHVNVANADMVAANVKLRKQVETLKKELTDSSLAYDRLRTESAREIAKWKLKIGGTTGGDTSLMAGSPSGYSTGGGGGGGTDKKAATVIADLQKKLDAVTKELRFERLSKSQNRNWNQTTNISPARGTSGSWNNNRSSAYSSWSNSADSARRSTSARTSSGTRGWSTTQTGRSTTTGIAGRSVSPVVGPRSSSSATGYRSRESTPPLRTRAPASSPTAAAPYSAGSGAQQRGSPALSSTLGRRFDPTEYQREKALLLQNRRAGRAWGAGATSSPNSTSGRYRYQSPSHGESGYASANSQVSTITLEHFDWGTVDYLFYDVFFIILLLVVVCRIAALSALPAQ